MKWMIHVLLCGCLGGVSLHAARAAAQASTEEQAASSKGEEAFRAALARLKSNNAAERAAAADEMGRRGHRLRHEIAAVLRPVLKSDPDAVVRASAGRALGRLGVREALPELIAALDDKSADVRVVAAAALWRLPDPSAVEPLLKHAFDGEAAVREWVAQALGVIGDTRATSAMIKLLSDSERAVRVAAVLSLGRIGDPAGLEPLVAYVQSGGRDDEEKEEVVNSIARLKTPKKVEALFTLLDKSENDPVQRMRLLAALGQVADPPAIQRIRPHAQGNAPAEVRKVANEAIADILKRSQSNKTSKATKPK